MPGPQPFSPRLIGQTEKAMNALLDRELGGTGIAEPESVTLVPAVTTPSFPLGVAGRRCLPRKPRISRAFAQWATRIPKA